MDSTASDDPDATSQYPRPSEPPKPPYPGYPQPPYPGYGPPVATQTNGMAIASMVLGILWLVWIGSILALIFGYLAKREIRDSGGTQTGDGFATAGIVLGWVGIGTLAFSILYFGYFIFVISRG